MRIKIYFYLIFILMLTGCRSNRYQVSLNNVLNDHFFVENINKVSPVIIAPSSHVDLKVIKALNGQKTINLKISDKLLSRSPLPYHANTDVKRYDEIKEALFNSNDYVLWTLRGGYGAARLLEHLKKLEKPTKEKMLIGYSDFTALHLFFSQVWGLKTIHGAFAAELTHLKKDIRNFTILGEIATNKISSITYNGLIPFNQQAKTYINITGKITGGNMTILQNSLGTFWQINGDDKIVFIEDVGVKGYMIDRGLYHLKSAKVFDKARAIILGDFKGDHLVDFALKRFAAEMNIPIYKVDFIGHGNKNYPIIYNSDAKIVLNAKNNNYDSLLIMNF